MALSARSNRPLRLQPPSSSRACQHFLSSQSRVSMLLSMTLLSIRPPNCRLRRSHLHQASLRSSRPLRVAPPCPSMPTLTHQMKSRGLLLNTKCLYLQIRSLNLMVVLALIKLRLPGAEVAIHQTSTSKCKSSFNSSSNKSLLKLPQQSSCLSKSKTSRKLCMQALKTLALLLFPI